MRLLCAGVAAIALLAMGVAVKAAHPCDIKPDGPWVQKTGKAPVVAWCQAGEHEGFIVSLDGALFDIKPVPTVGGVGIYGTYYAMKWPGGVDKGQHVFGVRAYIAGGGMQGPQAVLVFTR
jgi:hypothetical protein